MSEELKKKEEIPDWYHKLSAVCLEFSVSLLVEIKIRSIIEQSLIDARVDENEYWIKQTMRQKAIEYGYKDFEYRIKQLKEKE